MGERSDFDLTPGADDDSRTASVVQIRERVRPRPAALGDDNHDPIQDWDTHHARSLQLPVLDPLEGPLADDRAAERVDEVSVPHQRQLDSDADIFNLRSAPVHPATTLPFDQTGPKEETEKEETDESRDGEEGTEDPPREQSTSLRRAPGAAPQRMSRRTVACIALGAVITVAAVIAGLAVSTANRHGRPITHVKLAATAAPLTSTLAQDAGIAAKSISAELTRAAKAVKARAAAAARARQARARARATKERAARARAARLHKRRKPTHTHTTPSSSPSVATTASTYTQPTPYTQTTPAPSAPAESSNPSTATTSHQTAHPYGDGGLLGAGSSPSG